MARISDGYSDTTHTEPAGPVSRGGETPTPSDLVKAFAAPVGWLLDWYGTPIVRGAETVAETGGQVAESVGNAAEAAVPFVGAYRDTVKLATILALGGLAWWFFGPAIRAASTAIGKALT